MTIKIMLLLLALSLTACQNITKPDQTIPIEKSNTIVKENPSVFPSRDANKSLSDLFSYFSTGSQMPSIVSGKFVIKDNCLMWQVAKDNYMTPLFPSNEVRYLKAEKTVVLKGINVKLGETISTDGHITPTSSLEFVTQGDGACLTELGMAIDADIM